MDTSPCKNKHQKLCWQTLWKTYLSMKFDFSAGCIPIFLGPPFAALPFSKDLDYSKFSLSFFLETHEQWTAGISDEVSQIFLHSQDSSISWNFPKTLRAVCSSATEKGSNLNEKHVIHISWVCILICPYHIGPIRILRRHVDLVAFQMKPFGTGGSQRAASKSCCLVY